MGKHQKFEELNQKFEELQQKFKDLLKEFSSLIEEFELESYKDIYEIFFFGIIEDYTVFKIRVLYTGRVLNTSIRKFGSYEISIIRQFLDNWGNLDDMLGEHKESIKKQVEEFFWLLLRQFLDDWGNLDDILGKHKESIKKQVEELFWLLW